MGGVIWSVHIVMRRRNEFSVGNRAVRAAQLETTAGLQNPPHSHTHLPTKLLDIPEGGSPVLKHSGLGLTALP